MKQRLEEHEARLTAIEADTIWRHLRTRPARRLSPGRARPLLAAALVALLLAGAAGVRWQAARRVVADRLVGPAGLPVAERVQPAAAPVVSPSVSPSAAPSDAPARLRGHIRRADGLPEAHVTVLVEGTTVGAQSDALGNYMVENVPPGTHTLRAQKLGFELQIRDSVRVAAAETTRVDFTMAEVSVAELPTLDVSARQPRIVKSNSATRQSVSRTQLESLPVEHLSTAIELKSGVVAQGGELHFRGGRSGEVAYQIDGIPVKDPLSGGHVGSGSGYAGSASPGGPVVVGNVPLPGLRRITSLGGTDPINGEAFDAMFFKHYGVNPFVDPRDDRQATFALDVDNASYTLARSYLDSDQLPPPEAIRVEEFLNVLDQGYAPPLAARRDTANGEASEATPALAVHLEAAPSPFGPGLTLLRVGLKAREVADAERKPALLTFVIDVSGSMADHGRLETVKAALHQLLDEMRPDDRVGVVVFSVTSRIVLPLLTLHERARIEAAIDALQPEGSTNTEAGLVDGYAMAAGAFHAGWINRVILCSDGVANVGTTGAGGILDRIRDESRRGIELTAVGVGMGNYNDVLLEQLADQGDGNYYYVDDLREARRVFAENLTGTLQTVARQTKVQVEFDPALVRRYRLIGYENRNVADADFRNDAVDAGEVGSGHEVTALFELALDEGDSGAAPRGTLATVRLRYEDPDTKRVTERVDSLAVADALPDAGRAAPMFRLDAAVAEFAEILRDSYWARDSRLADAASLARSAARELGNPPPVEEMVTLMERAARLWSTRELGAHRFEAVRPRWEPARRGR